MFFFTLLLLLWNKTSDLGILVEEDAIETGIHELYISPLHSTLIIQKRLSFPLQGRIGSRSFQQPSDCKHPLHYEASWGSMSKCHI